jgi:hypothetical protein
MREYPTTSDDITAASRRIVLGSSAMNISAVIDAPHSPDGATQFVPVYGPLNDDNQTGILAAVALQARPHCKTGEWPIWMTTL